MADSLASSASTAGSSAVGSLSDSIQGSSNSSAGDKRVAEGDYRVIDVADAAGRPGLLRVKLRATDERPAPDGSTEFFLDLPKQAVEANPLATADVVTVRHRVYGMEFARAQTREPFFLVVADEWMRELAPRAVTL
jgi:hypothetical protein